MPTARIRFSVQPRCAALARASAAPAAAPRPTAAGVFGITRANARASGKRVESSAKVLPATMETTSVSAPARLCSDGAATGSACGFTASTSTSAAFLASGLSAKPRVERSASKSGEGCGSTTVTPAASSPASSQPRSMALPILPAPASASVRGQSVVACAIPLRPTGFCAAAKALARASRLWTKAPRALAPPRIAADLSPMKFSPEFLDEIKARLPASQVIGQRVKLKKQGREWRGLSPFNAEKTPSFYVNDQKQLLPRLLLGQAAVTSSPS